MNKFQMTINDMTTNPMTPETILPVDAPETGTYRHYKGNLYQVLGMARHSETEEWMVVYQALYAERGFWIRPLSIWLEPVVSNDIAKPAVRIDNKHVESSGSTPQRFQLVTPADISLTQLTEILSD